MNVNEKGNIGLIKVIQALYEKGYQCFLPFDDYCAADLIAYDKAGNTIRLQAKYRKKTIRRGKTTSQYQLVLASVVNGKKIPIDRSMIDGWAFYMADDDRIVFIPMSATKGKNTLSMSRDVCFDWL